MEANGPPYELARYRVGVVDVFVHDWAEGTRLYTSAGTTRSPAEVAEHDGPAIYEGDFRRFIEDGSIVEQHPHAGYRGAWAPDDTLDSEAILLTRVEGTRVLSDSGD